MRVLVATVQYNAVVDTTPIFVVTRAGFDSFKNIIFF